MGMKWGTPREEGLVLAGPRHIIEFEGEGYPEAFCHLSDPPKKLYIIGDPNALQEGIAIVGARKATPYGISCTKRFARIAALRHIPIISGGARGCDITAHQIAVGLGSVTVAFLGGGCDAIYPREHTAIFQSIIDNGGAMVSEHDWLFPPAPWAFRARNRLIGSLARATLVVEAGLPSGTFSTADEAIAANREVLVVPGSIDSYNSRGTNRLLYQGAIPIIDDDVFTTVLDSLFGQAVIPGLEEAPNVHGGGQEAVVLSEFEEDLLAAVTASPMDIEELLVFARNWEHEHGFDAACGADAASAVGEGAVGAGADSASAAGVAGVAGAGVSVAPSNSLGTNPHARLMMAITHLQNKRRIRRTYEGRYLHEPHNLDPI